MGFNSGLKGLKAVEHTSVSATSCPGSLPFIICFLAYLFFLLSLLQSFLILFFDFFPPFLLLRVTLFHSFFSLCVFFLCNSSLFIFYCFLFFYSAFGLYCFSFFNHCFSLLFSLSLHLRLDSSFLLLCLFRSSFLHHSSIHSFIHSFSPLIGIFSTLFFFLFSRCLFLYPVTSVSFSITFFSLLSTVSFILVFFSPS